MEPKISNSAPSLQDVEVKLTTLLDPDGAELRELHRQEVIAKYPAEAGLPLTAADLPVFMILKSKGSAIACGGLRPLRDDRNNMAELKRMYVVPEFRGRVNGIADFLMQQLELQAADKGWTVLRLETGVDMSRARKFYERHGYSEIPLYGHYTIDINSVQSVCYEKTFRNK